MLETEMAGDTKDPVDSTQDLLRLLRDVVTRRAPERADVVAKLERGDVIPMEDRNFLRDHVIAAELVDVGFDDSGITEMGVKLEALIDLLGPKESDSE